MPKIKLTVKAIERFPAPDPSGRQALHWDTELRGFGVLCSGKTGAKTYIVQRDLPGGLTRRVTIAPVNVLDLDTARGRAQDVIGDFYKGLDPKAGRRSDMTLRTALDEYLSARAVGEKVLRPGSAVYYRDGIETYLSSWLDLPLRTISRDMVVERLTKIADAVSKRTDHPGHAVANGAMRAFRAIYNFAADRAPPSNPMPPNPVKLKKAWLPVEARTRSVTPPELPKFYKAVIALPNPIARDYLLLLLFTGMRRREAGALRWDEVDLKEKVIRLPAARAKAGRKLDLPMSDVVFKILNERRKLGNATWVFPANSDSGHIEEPKFPLKLVGDASGVRVSAHDLRRTFVTVAESTDMSVMALKALINHALGKDVTEGYAQITADRLREPAQRVTDKLKKLCGIRKF
jgi:integrase